MPQPDRFQRLLL